ncbi:hypothetical protein D9619_004362 [Psilocybe cf. subviscida]|uniref:Methylosome subunit pICln n=1 Tax=Psilocybe cf. subviscida TaxID=2480587 RepID=A0A8H5F8K6_9AGAR|nr:hypothetical protein D9619_004362 [Psilocybe cf. subviscida]
MPAVKPISAVPKYISKEEHSALVASTPASFGDIPPVIRHKEENVSITLDPGFGIFTNATQGTLYILTSVLAFVSTAGEGFEIEYPKITLHAVSRGESGPSIYCQLDESAAAPDAPQNDDEISEMSELTIVPQNSASLEPMFEALSECASLHPDPRDEEDDLDDDAFVDINTFETFTGDENEELSEVGRAALAHLESIIEDPHELKPDLNDDDEK